MLAGYLLTWSVLQHGQSAYRLSRDLTMTKIADLPEFDMAEWLPDEAAVTEYLTAVLEESDPAALAKALGTIARARGLATFD